MVQEFHFIEVVGYVELELLTLLGIHFEFSRQYPSTLPIRPTK